MYLIKLGGSIITDKTKTATFKQKNMDRLAKEINKAHQPVILVHGAGSFGHILAKKHHINQGYHKPQQILGVSQTMAMVQHLNTHVLTSLQKNGIPAISLPPHTYLKLQNHEPHFVNLTSFKHYLKKGFTPVTFGDVVLDTTLGFSICSGDLLIQLLAKHFKPNTVIFVFDEDGLYTSNPKKDHTATLIPEATTTQLDTLTLQPDAHDDVTQGMKGKIHIIKTIAQQGTNTILLNGNINNRLYHTLTGKKTTSTLIKGEHHL